MYFNFILFNCNLKIQLEYVNGMEKRSFDVCVFIYLFLYRNELFFLGCINKKCIYMKNLFLFIFLSFIEVKFYFLNYCLMI